MRYSSVVAPLLAASALLPRSAWAAPPVEVPPARKPPAELAFMAGAAASMIPITLGAPLASSGGDDAAKNVGLAVIGAGFAIAPLVSHAVLGEWRRAAIFTLIPTLSEIGMVGLMAGRPDAVFHGTQPSRTTFGALLCFDVFFSALGLVDAVLAGDQTPPSGRWGIGARKRDLLVAPVLSAGRIGITVGGTL